MTPAARVAAAIEVLDHVLEGAAAEQVLTNWGRRNRFAGSRDRAAIRDHVFDALRCRRSHAARGGALTGRALMVGACRSRGEDPGTIFGADRHAPPPLSAEEETRGREPEPGPEALDCPDWLWPVLLGDLGDAAVGVLETLRAPAPVGLRANLARTSVADLMGRLAGHGISCFPDPRSPSALVLQGRPRGLQALPEWREGLFELQDVGAQAVADAVPLAPGETLIDYCAGGGGKTLAIAARVAGRFVAHDARPQRMKDLPMRAQRAGVTVCRVSSRELTEAETVLVDAPCSGSGTWRRTPEAKWRLTAEALVELTGAQAAILDAAVSLLRPGGHLVYATCSVLQAENEAVVAGLLERHPHLSPVSSMSLLPDQSCDGHFCAVLRA